MRRPSAPPSGARAARPPRRTPTCRLALALALGLCALTCLPSPAGAAESCPGAGAGPCPYTGAVAIGSRAEGVLRFPEAVALDAQGDVYVGDQLSYTVQKFSAAGALEAEWGSYGGGHGQFGPIGGIAVGSEGDVYVVDSSHNRVEKFGPDGEYLGDWGHRGTEVGDFDFGSSQNPAALPGGGIAVAGGYVFVADSGNNRIERFNLDGGEAMAWGGAGGAPGQFSYPRGVAANEHEVIVSDDDNHRVEEFTTEGAFVAAAGTQGAGPEQFGYPYGVALDALGNVYVADDSNDRVVKLNPQLGFEAAWGGAGAKPGELAFPRALAAAGSGETYVADAANDRIEVFSPEGEYLRTIGISARGPGQLTAPMGLALDPTGRLLVADTDSARVELFAPGSDSYAGQWTGGSGAAPSFDGPGGIGVERRGGVLVADRADGRVLRYWGDGTYLSELVGPGHGGAELRSPGAVAVSPASGEIYIADSGHNRILVYGPEGSLKARWGAGEGDGEAGSAPGDFDDPRAVAVASSGDVYVADTGNERVVELSPSGAPLGEWGAAGTGDGRFRSPTGIGVDAAGRVYVLDSENDRVQEFTANGSFLARWGERGTGTGQLSFPSALAVGCEGDVYVADTDNNRVQRFEPLDRAGSGCLSVAAWPPPLNVAPVLSISLLHRTGVLAHGGLAMTVACQRGCTIGVSATLAPYGRRAPGVTLLTTRRGLPPARAGHVQVRVARSALRRLRRELGREHAMWARVRIVAIGPTGKVTIVHRSYVVAR
jgi:tripartite motif-containing protein 71